MAASEAEIRDALAWETGTKQAADKSTWEWLWEAIQGDFNDNRSTGQIAFDAAVSMIPVVDQVCDVRDIIANCKGISQSKEGEDNTWKWIALALTLIGLFPSLGSLVKGVLKIFFVFVRRMGLNQLVKAVDVAMTWVITFLRKKEVQDYLRKAKVDEVFKWLADAMRTVRGQVNAKALLAAFDKAIGVMKKLLDKVTWMPRIGDKAKQALDLVDRIRKQADAPLAKAVEPLQKILDAIIRRLEIEHIVHRSGIVDARSFHFRGTLPEAQAVKLMRNADPLPPWLSKGKPGVFAPLKANDPDVLQKLNQAKAEAAAQAKAKANKLGIPDSDVPVDDWPKLTKGNIESFHKLDFDEIVGPAKLYRVLSPSSGAMGDCWVSEEVFHKLMKASDPKAAWRKHLAVWPDWNANGQFVVCEIPKGESLKVWRGATSSQVKEGLDANLEGGWEQIIFNPTKTNKAQWDSMRIYQRTGNTGELKEVQMTYADYRALPPSKKHAYVPVREKINDPRIKGPYDTNWGVTDFDPQMQDAKIGLPALSGQVSNK